MWNREGGGMLGLVFRLYVIIIYCIRNMALPKVWGGGGGRRRVGDNMLNKK